VKFGLKPHEARKERNLKNREVSYWNCDEEVNLTETRWDDHAE
jgi:hypothetical protein